LSKLALTNRGKPVDRAAAAITWVFTCRSLETLRLLKRIARHESDLGKVFVDVAVAFPGGVEQRTMQHHRLGDYFDRIQVLSDDSPASTSFSLVFQPRPGAGRYWKDLMVQILRTIETAAADVSIKSLVR
jgi:hypothetical protein